MAKNVYYTYGIVGYRGNFISLKDARDVLRSIMRNDVTPAGKLRGEFAMWDAHCAPGLRGKYIYRVSDTGSTAYFRP